MAKIWRYGALVGIVIALVSLLQLQGQPGSISKQKLETSRGIIPAQFFSLNLINLEYGAIWPTVPFWGWRNTYSVWSTLEPQPGQWNFAAIDADVALAEKQGVEIMLLLQNPPTWASARPEEAGCCPPFDPKGNIAEPRNLEDWRHYVRTVATRYKGKVHYYELWNEPNVKRFYSGSIAQLVRLNQAAYEVLKSVDPKIQVVSSGLSPYGDHLRYFEQYLALGGGEAADIIGYHFYVAPQSPEAMIPVIQQVQALMAKYQVADKPLWNTEMGWKIRNRDRNINDEEWAGSALPLTDASAYIARSYILNWVMGVERLYWYAWGHRSMGLTEYDLKSSKPTVDTYTQVQRWLVGATLKQCEVNDQQIWICQLQRNNASAWIVWHPERRQLLALPTEWNVKKLQALSGTEQSLSGMSQIEISPSPVLLE